MKLTETQMKHLHSVEWLLSDSKGEGKTTLILYCLFLKARRSPNTYISIIDHYPMTYAKWDLSISRLLEIMIRDEEFKGLDFRINHVRQSIIYIPH